MLARAKLRSTGWISSSVPRSLEARSRRRLRDLLDHLADSLLSGADRDVRLCQDAYQSVLLVDDRESPHLPGRHQLQRLRQVVVRLDRDELAARDLAHG